MLREVIRAHGHENVSGTHETTFEVTTDDFLTPAGDCILGIEADRAPAAFDPEFVAACRNSDTTLVATVRVEWDRTVHETSVTARGDPELTFESEQSAVVRTSDYVDDRTVAVGADHAAAGFDRALVAVLSDGADLTLTLSVNRP